MEKNQPNSSAKFLFDRTNYIIMIVGLLLIFTGFIIMSMDKEEYGFGFLGLTLGPIVTLLGFLVEFVAIFYKPKK